MIVVPSKLSLAALALPTTPSATMAEVNKSKSFRMASSLAS
jgi:hypothetical protein